MRLRLRRAVRCCARLAAIGGICVFAGCQSILSLTNRGETWSPAEQARIGSLAHREYLNAHQPVQQPEQRLAVEQVGRRLASASGRPEMNWQFEVVVDRTPRVVGFPGGRIVVSDALLAACRNEAELAAAISHEMGHLLAGHGLERLHQHRDAQHTKERGALSPGPAFAADEPSRVPPYSLRHEAEADSIALSLLVQAGYDPDAAHAFWMRAAAEQASPEFRDLARLHPVPRGRLSQLETSLAQARGMYRSHPGPLGQGAALAFEVHHEPMPEAEPIEQRPAAIASSTNAHRPTGPSLWTASANRDGTKPDTWDADLVLPAPGPALPPQREVMQAGFEQPERAPERSRVPAADDDEWLTPIIRRAD
jgi:predicted Zn-dependent protease